MGSARGHPPIFLGAVYDVSMILSPFLGGLIDIVGKRGYLALSCAVFTIPVFGLLAFTSVYPVVATLWLGITYSFAAASMWPSIPLVVNPATIGTAMGLTTSIQMIGIGISNTVVGQILGKGRDVPVSHWNYVMIFLLANTLACITMALFLNINDRRKGGVLNLSKKQKEALANGGQGTTVQGGKGTTVQATDEDSSSEDEREPLIRNRK